MKRIIILAYYFPPLGMGGSQRPAKFAKYLPEFGWQPTVVTVKPLTYWAQDISLLKELSEISIIRTDSLDPQRLLERLLGLKVNSRPASSQERQGHGFLQKINEILLPFFLLPDSKILWRFHAIRAVSELLEKEKFDAIFTTSPPHSVHLIGKKLAKKFKLKWVADFRDSWVGGVVVHEPTPLQRWVNQVLQKTVLNSADAIISVSDGIQNELKKSIPNSREKFYLIPNGFDESDYPVAGDTSKDKRFVFCHCGSITKFSDPEPVLTALKLFKKKYPRLVDRVLFQFVGYDVLGDFTRHVQQAGLDDMISYMGYKPHHEALQYLVNADALLLIARGPKGATFIPGKTFEYLGALKPILALSNVADTIAVLQNTNLSVVLGLEDPSKIADEIAHFLQKDWKSSKTAHEKIQQFSRRNQAKQLASILDKN
jgi:glycosyltransferase involved in cell wall biosynthesis